MIIFIDFDGVLHPTMRGEPDFSRVQFFWKILGALPEAQVVFSTSWKELYPVDELIAYATKGGGEEFAHRFIGATPEKLNEPGAYIYVAGKQYHRRHLECEMWLIENNQTKRQWLAIDDVARWFPPNSPNLYLIDGKLAMTELDSQRIIEKLMQGRSAK